jgi:proline iminopeptidase
MHNLYPAIKPYQCHELAVENPHVLYIEETGNPQGLPVIILHAGPGAGSDSYMRRFFDPSFYRIIIFDQRGCGRSTPHANTQNNTTSQLLEDIDAVRDYLKINRFIISGGGWGCLLALLYAELYPSHISGLLLYKIFLGRKTDISWFYKQGASLIYPDYWKEFTHQIPEEELNSIPKYYANRMQSDNELARMAAAKSWSLWQARCSTLQPHQSIIDQYSDPHAALALATLEPYYVSNNYFIEENQILNNINKIRHVPTHLVHGRYDMICPLAGAWDLHQNLYASNLSIIRDAGHSDRESGIIDALITASKEIAKSSLDAS